MEELKSIQDMVLANLEKKYAHSVYQLWFEDLELKEMTETDALFTINTDFKRSILEKNYTVPVTEALAEVLGFKIEVRFSSTEGENGESKVLELIRKKSEEEEEEQRIAAEKYEKEMTLKMESQSIVEEYHFGNFVVGESNKFAFAACFAVATEPFTTYNPLFIHGPSGLGKTHLLFAITNEIKKKHPNVRIVYKKGEEFTNELIASLKDNTMESFRNKYRRHTDVLLIDDIQFIAGKTSTQEEFFHTFSALFESGKQIIITSDRPPKEINPLEERLRSRFEWGVIADIQPPTEELRSAIIQMKADQLKINIPEDAMEFLANSLQKNIRQIEGAIKKIAAISDITHTPITLDMCRRAIADIVSGVEPSPVTVDRILNVVAMYYGVCVADLKGTSRKANIAYARHMAIFLMRNNTDMSLTEIGNVFGRDHATTVSSIKRIEGERYDNPEVHTVIGELTNKIKAQK